MSQDKLPYDRMLQDAMRDVFRKALLHVIESGLPGAHHFYITFRTSYPGVDIPGHLRETYPEDMTIVLQHQFYGLEVTDAYFQVTLSFKKRLERLRIPFAALVSFVDPAVNFGLQFQVEETAAPDPAPVPAPQPASSGSAAPAADETGEPTGAERVEKVVSLDAFRKK